MRALLQINVGIPISFIVLCFLVGGVQDAARFMVASIICTAGVSLAVWIPVWYALGFLAASIFEAVGTRSEHKPAERPTRHQKDVEVVTKYLRLAETSTLSHAQITAKLEAAGWSRAIIDEAQRQLAQATHT